jgi:hypothetical protein
LGKKELQPALIRGPPSNRQHRPPIIGETSETSTAATGETSGAALEQRGAKRHGVGLVRPDQNKTDQVPDPNPPRGSPNQPSDSKTALRGLINWYVIHGGVMCSTSNLRGFSVRNLKPEGGMWTSFQLKCVYQEHIQQTPHI